MKFYVCFYEKSISVTAGSAFGTKVLLCCSVQIKPYSSTCCQLLQCPRSCYCCLPSCCYKCLSLTKHARGEPIYLAISRVSHRKTKNINTRQKCSLLSLWGLGRKELNEIQIVEEFLFSSEPLTEEGNGYPKCEIFIVFPI